MNESDTSDLFEDFGNPLDCVEELMVAHNWVFDRMNEDELVVRLNSDNGTFCLYFVWQEAEGALQFCCQIGLEIPEPNLPQAAAVIASINAGLWLGHFDLSPSNPRPNFRHTSLFRGLVHHSVTEHIEDLMEIGLRECERFFPVFQILAEARMPLPDLMELAVVEHAGEA